MENSIVIFGMAHSGKTTCAGYIYNELNKGKKGYDFEAYIDTIRKKLLDDYDDSRDYGYLLDKGDELYRPNNKKEGTSKQLHLKNVCYNDLKFTIIDTPGAQHSDRQRQKGMFYGDIGIFFIEINVILDEKLYYNQKLFSSLISTLILWSKYKRTTIVALTKMDVLQYSQKDFQKARSIILQLCDNLNISAVIPISINVKERKGHNIFKNSSLMQWYSEDTLMNIIIKEINNIKKEKAKNKLLFTVDKSYMQPIQQVGKCWRIKILSGSIEIGQKIILAPVKINNDFISVTATIKSIRSDFSTNEGIEQSENAIEGDIVGIDLGNIYMGHKKLNKKEINTISTSLGLDIGQEYKMTNEFSFCTNPKNLDKISIKKQMDLLWYGRPVTFEIIEKNITNRGVIVRGKIMGRVIVIPISKTGEFLNSKVIIRYDTNGIPNPFIDAELVNNEKATNKIINISPT